MSVWFGTRLGMTCLSVEIRSASRMNAMNMKGRLLKTSVLLGLLFAIPYFGFAQVWTDGYNSHTRFINDIHITPDHDIFLFGGYPPALGGDRIGKS
jgi:hypothetical protein